MYTTNVFFTLYPVYVYVDDQNFIVFLTISMQESYQSKLI